MSLITFNSILRRSSYAGRWRSRSSGSGNKKSKRSTKPSSDTLTKKSAVDSSPVGKLGRKYSPKRTVALQRLAISTELASASGISANNSHISSSLRKYCSLLYSLGRRLSSNV